MARPPGRPSINPGRIDHGTWQGYQAHRRARRAFPDDPRSAFCDPCRKAWAAYIWDNIELRRKRRAALREMLEISASRTRMIHHPTGGHPTYMRPLTDAELDAVIRALRALNAQTTERMLDDEQEVPHDE